MTPEGTTFNRLTYIKPAIQVGYGEFMCACGKSTTKRWLYVLSGDTKSCGCLKRESTIARNKARATHGDSHNYLHTLWDAIQNRCYNTKNKDFAKYGGRGITVCEEWRNSYEVFKQDVGSRPTSSHSLDRKNNNRGYSKDNCRWATPAEQAQNRRNSDNILFQGKEQCLTQWSRDINVPADTLRRRLRVLGWSIDRALTTPLRRPHT